MAQRLNISSGAPWESVVGYSRAVRIGNLVEVAGTAAVDGRGNVVGAGDAYEQTRYALTKIEGALRQAGASMQDVIRTRLYVTDMSRWQDIGRAHAEFFRDILPVTTMVEVRSLIAPDLLVEVEVTAIAHD